MVSYKIGKLWLAEIQAKEIIKKYPNHPLGWKALGAIYGSSGKLKESLQAKKQSVHLSFHDPEAHCNLGSAFKALGHLTEAERSYRDAIRLKPDYAQAHSNLGLTLNDLGRLSEAERSYREAIRIKPELTEAHFNLGVTLSDLGRLSEAEASYREAIRTKPDYAKAHYILGLTLANLERLSESETSYREALRLKPDYAEAHSDLGVTLNKLGRFIEAEASYREAIHLKPDYAEAHSNLGVTLNDLGRLSEAEASYREALRLKPDFAQAQSNLGVTLNNLGRSIEAEKCYREALRHKPDYAEAHNNLGLTFNDLGRLIEAEMSYREAIRLNPNYAHAYSNLGITLNELGRLIEAEASYREAIRLKPDYAKAHSNLLLSQNYMESLAREATVIEAKDYGVMVSSKATPKFSCWHIDSRESRLRVGFVSGDFKNHPVGYFIEGLLKYLDQKNFEIYAFTTTPKEDELTRRIKLHVNHLISVYEKNDQDAAKLIHQHGIHILIDLSGHTALNRLPIFSYKPAPVQISWLGYFATTGLPEMDYILGDPIVTPERDANYFSESIWQMPETYLCFTPPIEDISVGQLPALINRYITFGCFNNLTKMSTAVIALWSRVLHSLPTAKLFLKTKQLSEPIRVNEVIEKFASFNIPVERLILEGPSTREALLTAYNKVDIALDPFPYPGGTTTAEALWMGVPVLTLKGNRFLSRVGETIAHNAESSEWIAADHDDYLEKAVAYATDLEKLSKLRQNLRAKVLQSPLFDSERFAKNFENALIQMWEVHEND